MRKIVTVVVLGTLLGIATGFAVRGQINVVRLESLVSRQEETIAEQASLIVEQEAAITEQIEVIANQQDKIEEQTLFIEGLEVTNRGLRETIAKQEREISDLSLEKEYLEVELRRATFELGEDMLVMPRKSPEFDCDDGALYMYLHFSNMGYEVRIIVGNLDLVNESWEECNHVWVWVRSGGSDYPYDWGRYCPDKQHRWGYPISYDELLQEALKDSTPAR